MKKGRAFTLIELLVVFAIIGLSLMAVAPKIGERVAKGEKQSSFFADLIAEHLVIARDRGAPVYIQGFKGDNNIITYEGKHLSIPGVKSVQSVAINNQPTPTIDYYITVYPDGLCDHFVIETDAKEVIESNPILMTTTRKKIK